MFFLLALILCLLAAPAQAGFNQPIGCAQTPALTGDVTTAAGSCATTGVWRRISTQTASGAASIAFTGLATYDIYQLECQAIFPATNTTTVNFQVGEGGTPTWEASSYKWFAQTGASSSTTVNGTASASDTGIRLESNNGNVVAKAFSTSITISNVTSTSTVKHVFFKNTELDTDQFVNYGAGSYTGDTNAVTAVRIIAASGNISGKCTLLGLVP